MIWALILLSKGVMWVWSFIWYPIAYVFRDPVRDNYYNGNKVDKVLAFPFWIVLDDEEDYGEEWFMPEHPNNLWKSWCWAFVRNNSWNWNSLVRVKTGLEVPVGTKDDNKLLHHRFKWEYKVPHPDGATSAEAPVWLWVGDWNTNKGERLSQERTSLGTSFCKYMVWKDGVIYGKYWRFSHAGIHGFLMLNIKAGYNKRGEALLDIKIKRFKPFYTEHWT